MLYTDIYNYTYSGMKVVALSRKVTEMYLFGGDKSTQN